MSTDKKFCRKSLRTPVQKQNNQPGTCGFVAMIPFKFEGGDLRLAARMARDSQRVSHEYSVHKLRGTPRSALRAGLQHFHHFK
jgi:hypothetical protein